MILKSDKTSLFMITLFDALLSDNVQEAEEAKESIVRQSGEDIVRFFSDIPLETYKNHYERASVLLCVIINDSFEKIREYFTKITINEISSHYSFLFQFSIIESKENNDFSPFSLLIALLFISQSKIIQKHLADLQPLILSDDETTILPRLNILINLLSIIEKLKTPQRKKTQMFQQELKEIINYFKNNSISVLINATELNELVVPCATFLIEITKIYPYIFLPEEFVQIFDSLPNILPNADILLYDRIYSLLTCITFSSYDQNFFIELSFPERIYHAFENGLSTQNSFLTSTLKMWYYISEYEFNLIKENESLHNDFIDKFSKDCHFLSTYMLSIFI